MKHFDFASGLRLLKFGGPAFGQTQSNMFDHCITTRKGGISPYPYDSLNLSYSTGDYKDNVDKNISLAAAALGSNLENVIAMDQCHSANVGVVSATVLKDKMRDLGYFSFYNVDALITNEPGFTLLARSADCPLVLLLDTVSGSLGVVHSGWRGTFLNIVNAAVRGMMLHFGAEPKNMSAGIGPSISLRHYRVGIKSINLFKNTVPAEELSRCYHFDGKDYSLNLKSIIAWQLEQAGIKKIALSEQCTFEQAELFFSYRREGSKTGRFGLLARLKKAIGYCMV